MIKEGSLNQLRRFVKSKVIPFSVVFEITHRCNLHCIHCYQENKKKKELSLKEIKLIFDDLEKLGTMKLTITGGEPLLREDFTEIYYLAQQRFAVTLFSNATLLESEHKKSLIKRRPLVVECSLYGATAKTHELITQVNGSFDKTLRSIKWMVGKGIRVIIKSIILSLNFHELNALSELCHGLGVSFHPSFRVYPSADSKRSVEKLRIATEDFKELLKTNNWLLKYYREHNFTRHQSGEFICNAGREACCIDAEGKVFPCVALRWESGDLRQQSFSEIWLTSPIFKKIRELKDEDFTSCFSCPQKRFCNFCPGLGFSEQGNILAPSSEICRLTRIQVSFT